MCSTCGCGSGEVRVEGEAHAHEHRHADGTVHTHGHDGELAQVHTHGHEHGAHGLESGSGPAHAHAPGLEPSRMLRIVLPYLEFDLERCVANALRTNPGLGIISVSAATGEGIPEWITWLEQGAGSARAARRETAELQGSGPVGPETAVERSLMG